MKSIVCCVDFGDMLSVTLPKNKHHFSQTMIVTSSRDAETQRLAAEHGVSCCVTDVFYDNGAAFNKGAAMEVGFDALGRDGWICIWDADIVMPESMPMPVLSPGCLYGVPRRILDDPLQYSSEMDWGIARPTVNHEFQGYFQLFCGNRISPPWYGTTWQHAGGCDSDFLSRFPESKRVKLPFEVLHLGPAWGNWHGRVSPRIDTGAVAPEAEERARQQAEMFDAQRKAGILPPIEEMG